MLFSSFPFFWFFFHLDICFFGGILYLGICHSKLNLFAHSMNGAFHKNFIYGFCRHSVNIFFSRMMSLFLQMNDSYYCRALTRFCQAEWYGIFCFCYARITKTLDKIMCFKREQQLCIIKYNFHCIRNRFFVVDCVVVVSGGGRQRC